MKRVSRLAMTLLVSAGLSLGGFGLAAGTAHADAWPGCPNDHPEGPCRWCPGDPPVQTGNHITNPVVWDESVCHTYWYVYFGQGNVAQNIFEGDTPPPPPPPPPPALINRDNCAQILGIFCPRA
ncbi:hypothetical protein GGC64_002033 [Mycobacterium sp. OAS707]|jgi:hypothetical protein|uniref:hypothetical protein n=1 Tax=unclassified Mycobacterium TaxID=2642494 RepID=UPI0019FAEBB5|nr:hypothetical protein [Mycobacterium sp. OAS707]MBE1548025.1 hypothetical protein [Mycobacterium sp. OAS707]